LWTKITQRAFKNCASAINPTFGIALATTLKAAKTSGRNLWKKVLEKEKSNYNVWNYLGGKKLRDVWECSLEGEHNICRMNQYKSISVSRAAEHPPLEQKSQSQMQLAWMTNASFLRTRRSLWKLFMNVTDTVPVNKG
jgi:hypothetical protein